jgi:rod shape-determining protein MreD
MLAFLRPAIAILLLLLTAVIQSFLVYHLPWMSVLDLPLIAIMYVVLTRNSLLMLIALSSCLGIWQDSLSLCPYGMNGLVKLTVGTIAYYSSTFLAVDRINTRWGMLFSCSMLSSLLFWILRVLFLNREELFAGQAILLGGLLNASLGLILFYVFDKILHRQD